MAADLTLPDRGATAHRASSVHAASREFDDPRNRAIA